MTTQPAQLRGKLETFKHPFGGGWVYRIEGEEMIWSSSTSYPSRDAAQAAGKARAQMEGVMLVTRRVWKE